MNVQGATNLLFRAGLRKDFLDEIKKYEECYSQYLKSSNMDGPELSATIMVGMRRLFELGDGEAVSFDDPKIGPKVVGVDKEFGLGFQVSKKTVEDDLYNKANQSSKWLGHAVNMTKEYRSAQLIDDAFTGATFKGIDNLALCSTAHTLINSDTTVANRPTTEVGLSVSGITTLMNLAALCKDENGDPHKVMPNTLMIGNDTTNYHKALQIFKSAKEPFTTDNQDNAMKLRKYDPKIIVNPYMASTTAYFLFDSATNDCHFVTRRAPLFEDNYDFLTRASQFSVTMRFLIWFVSWRAWYGANPS